MRTLNIITDVHTEAYTHTHAHRHMFINTLYTEVVNWTSTSTHTHTHTCTHVNIHKKHSDSVLADSILLQYSSHYVNGETTVIFTLPVVFILVLTHLITCRLAVWSIDRWTRASWCIWIARCRSWMVTYQNSSWMYLFWNCGLNKIIISIPVPKSASPIYTTHSVFVDISQVYINIDIFINLRF